MKVIKATGQHLKDIMEIIGHAQAYLAGLNIDQWQNGYPNEDRILQDIALNASYLLLDENEKIMATAMFTTDPEPTYASILGEWITPQNAKYGVIHRMAVHNDYRKTGAARKLFDYFENQLTNLNIASMRIDTHEDNLGMQKLLKLNNYHYCGIIHLDDGAKRLAFEKIIVSNEDLKRDTLKTWDGLAAAYADKFMHLDIYDDSYKSFCSLLPENAKVLELGAGPGNVSKKILELRPDLDLHVTDSSINMIEKAKEFIPEVRTTLLDLYTLNSHNEKYDAILCAFVLPYISSSKLKEVIENITRLLNPKGVLYVSFVPATGSKIKLHGDHEKGRMLFHYHDRKELVDILNKLHFTIKTNLSINYDLPEGNSEIHEVLISELS
ncbi:Acetyltransferase (GNAT) family protein [Lishizhenia tianjinensis]|uniref:Acetyltransferase (GNAT) family protein n=1 Tax=Lishizhenia tianjinensis TaxID=477690 RepID=A0A1I6YRC1_9FLAO|nr:bifunctional GNAT family N-acetyltransferase/class I SAM-dependent methyltransferase [Lishizhenia tianjinensis]SFT52918.1 Acetyltransferase (GNAT) family protein [Lishizhenia tianjinensis]